jgi:hypothetical protein
VRNGWAFAFAKCYDAMFLIKMQPKQPKLGYGLDHL